MDEVPGRPGQKGVRCEALGVRGGGDQVNREFFVFDLGDISRLSFIKS